MRSKEYLNEDDDSPDSSEENNAHKPGIPAKFPYAPVNADLAESLDPNINLQLNRKDIDEQTFAPAWTPQGMMQRLGAKVSPGSIKGSIFNMILATVGGGILSLSFGVRQVGLIPGILLLIFSCLLSFFTNDLLLICADHIRHEKVSFLTLSTHCSDSWGPKLATFTQGMLVVQMVGAFICYEVAYGGLLDLVWRVVVNDTEVYAYVILIMTWAIIYPLSLLRSMGALRFTSLFGITCSTYLAILITVEYFVLCDGREKELNNNDEIHSCFWKKSHLPNHAYINYTNMWSFIKNFLVCFPLFVFAYTSQQYMLPIYSELQHKTHARMQKVLRRSSYIILFVYVAAASFGYLTFLDGACGNILLNDYKKSPGAILAAIAISISMILTQPITTFTWRSFFCELVWKMNSKDLSTTTHIVLTTIYTFIGMLVALLVTDIAVVFGLMGATTYPLCGFVLPGIYFYNIVPAEKFPIRRILAVAQAVLVGAISLASLIYQVYGMIDSNTNLTKCNNMQDIKTPNFFK